MATPPPPPPVRVVLVDDSAVIRRLLGGILEGVDGIEVVGTAHNGRAAVERAPRLRPDVIVLDIEMPEVDGLAALPQLKALLPATAVIMFSTLTERAASATLEALARGADDYVTKPSNTGSFERTAEQVREVLVPKILALGPRRRAARPRPVAAAPPRTPAAPAAPAPPAAPILDVPPALVALGVSTGGPQALARILPALPADLPVPVLVTQHMPPIFTRLLAERLDAQCAVAVREAAPGAVAGPAEVWIAPGGAHLVVRAGAGGEVRLDLDDGPPVHSCKPAVDVMTRSAVDAFGAAVLAVVLTGMGTDGGGGAEAVRRAGGRVIAQDEATSVVWGMPGAVVRAGLATDVLPLEQIPARLVQLTAPTASRSGWALR
jgi:two-component system, chemotaxis family, protein-glutamate methylesterase/glutaminase